MGGESDPGFVTYHPVFDSIRSLALACAILVILTVSGAYPCKKEPDCTPGAVFSKHGEDTLKRTLCYKCFQ